MTVLGEFVLPHGGHAWTQTLIRLLGLLGVRDKAVRQALARMDARGLLAREKVGRQTRWSLTADSLALLEAGADRIYSFGQQPRPWDGRWVVLLASVPESERKLRYRVGQGLNWAGFGSVGPGVWLSPWVDRELLAVDVLTRHGVDGTSFRSELGELGSAQNIATQAWDLPALQERYDAFISDVGASPAPAHEPDVAVAELTRLVHRWRRFPFLDPDLPAELLPADWPGVAAAERFSSSRAARGELALRWWTTTEAEFTPLS